MNDYTEMTREAQAEWEELAEKIESRATAWVNHVVPEMHKALRRAGITYSEDLICECLADGFKAGYLEAMQKVSDNLRSGEGE